MFETIKNAWKIKEIRNKIFFTIFIILIFRIGAVIPVPYVDFGALREAAQAALANVGTEQASSDQFFSYLSILTGGGLEYGAIFGFEGRAVEQDLFAQNILGRADILHSPAVGSVAAFQEGLQRKGADGHLGRIGFRQRTGHQRGPQIRQKLLGDLHIAGKFRQIISVVSVGKGTVFIHRNITAEFQIHGNAGVPTGRTGIHGIHGDAGMLLDQGIVAFFQCSQFTEGEVVVPKRTDQIILFQRRIGDLRIRIRQMMKSEHFWQEIYAAVPDMKDSSAESVTT